MNSSNTFPQSSGDRTIVRAIGNDDNKRTASFRNNSTDALNSKILWQKAEGLHRFKAINILAWKLWSRYKILPLTMILYLTNIFWERYDQFTPMEHHKAYQPHSRAGPRPTWRWSTQYTLQFFVGGVLVIFDICAILCLVVIVTVSLLWFLCLVGRK